MRIFFFLLFPRFSHYRMYTDTQIHFELVHYTCDYHYYYFYTRLLLFLFTDHVTHTRTRHLSRNHCYFTLSFFYCVIFLRTFLNNNAVCLMHFILSARLTANMKAFYILYFFILYKKETEGIFKVFMKVLT